MLKKGDKCHVRLKSGEIVEAQYDMHMGQKHHFVSLFSGGLALAVTELTNDTLGGIPDCRFVCMTGMNKGKDNG